MVVLTTTLAFAAPSSAADCNEVDVEVEDDACGGIVAVSVLGNAQGYTVTVSATQDASNQGGDGACASTNPEGPSNAYLEVSCIAVSGMGNASNEAGASSCGVQRDPERDLITRSTTASFAVGCVAVAPLGYAENRAGAGSCGVSEGVSGDARLPSGAVGCVALSGRGDVNNEASDGSCGRSADTRGSSMAIGCIALAGDGEAHNRIDDDHCWFWYRGYMGGGVSYVELGCLAADV